MAPRDAHPPTASVRRAGWLGSAAAGVVAVAAAIAGRLGPQTGDPGWIVGVPGSVTSAVSVLTPVLIAATAVRLLAHPDSGSMPVNAARATVAGVTAVLWCATIGATAVLATAVTALLAGQPAGEPAVWALLALLVAAAVMLGRGARDLTRARAGWSAAFAAHGRLRDANRPDLLDDVSTLTARLLPGSLTARSGARLNRGLDEWPWSPRRHRAGFVATAATLAGVGLPGWQSVVSGPWSGPLALVMSAALVSGLVAAALGAGIVWLGFLRPLPE